MSDTQGLLLETCKFEFSQDAHCNAEHPDMIESLEIEVHSSLGIDREKGEGYYFVLKTDCWAINDLDDLKKLIERIEKSIKI